MKGSFLRFDILSKDAFVLGLEYEEDGLRIHLYTWNTAFGQSGDSRKVGGDVLRHRATQDGVEETALSFRNAVGPRRLTQEPSTRVKVGAVGLA